MVAKIAKQKRVMGFGTFDGVHPGHLAFLKNLKKLGSEVTVVIARDSNVLRIKGHSPRLSEKKRLEALEKTGLADRVILGNQHDFYQCLKDHKPQVIGLGYDQRADETAIQEVLPTVKIVRLKAFQPEKYKSSLLSSARGL